MEQLFARGTAKSRTSARSGGRSRGCWDAEAASHPAVRTPWLGVCLLLFGPSANTEKRLFSLPTPLVIQRGVQKNVFKPASPKSAGMKELLITVDTS